jgi:hypothetical protein
MILRLNLAGDLRLLITRIEASDRSDAALAGDKILPSSLDVAAKRRHQPETSHYDTAHVIHLQTQQAQTRAG